VRAINDCADIRDLRRASLSLLNNSLEGRGSTPVYTLLYFRRVECMSTCCPYSQQSHVTWEGLVFGGDFDVVFGAILMLSHE
jgi:hypothetical protein